MRARSPVAWSLFLIVAAACARKPSPAPTPPVVADEPAPAAAPAPPRVERARTPIAGKPKEGLIPRAVLFGNPERGAPLISPDGKHIAFSAPADGVMNVFVAPANDLTKAVQVTSGQTRPVRRYFFSEDSKWVLFLQDIGGDENFHLFRVGIDGKDQLDLTPKPGALAMLYATSLKKPGTVMVGLNDRDARLHDVYQVDLKSGKSKLILQNPGHVGYSFDEDLKLRLAHRAEPDGSITYLTPSKDLKKWTEHQKIGPDDNETTGILHYDVTGRRYYLLDSRGRDRAGLFAVDARSGKGKLVAEHDKADAGGMIIHHPKTLAIRAIAFDYTRPEWKVLDKSIAKDVTALSKVDDGVMNVISMSRADDVWIVGFAGDRKSPRFFRWDRKKQQATFLYAVRPALDDLPLSRMQPVIIPARDGLQMVSYLTLPTAADPDGDGKPTAPQPMVLFVHGGPWARDGWGFRPGVQMLANRGYAVLQVNYRGSTGFGKAFVNAANRQWGKKMHDDLVDAVGWAVQSGITTAANVCIMGGSYGGYATLAGLTLTPRVFKCGVDIVGISSIPTFIAAVPPYWQPYLDIIKQRVGDWTTPDGNAALLESSPLTHAHKIERPLLIAQGANDPRVKKAESDQIVGAMQNKQLPVTYVLFPDEGHGFARPENNIAFMALAEAFLSAHLGGVYQPMTAADFTGSSLQILAGRDGIPGLPPQVGKTAAQPPGPTRGQ